MICAYNKYIFVNTHVHVFTGNQLYELIFWGVLKLSESNTQIRYRHVLKQQLSSVLKSINQCV